MAHSTGLNTVSPRNNSTANAMLFCTDNASPRPKNSYCPGLAALAPLGVGTTWPLKSVELLTVTFRKMSWPMTGKSPLSTLW